MIGSRAYALCHGSDRFRAIHFRFSPLPAFQSHAPCQSVLSLTKDSDFEY